MSTPLLSSLTPKVSRDVPETWSIPIRPMNSPRKSETMPRVSEEPTSAVTETKASTVSAK